MIEYILPFLGFGVTLITIKKGIKDGWGNLAVLELLVAGLIMVVSIIVINSNSKDSKTLKNGITELLAKRKTDSIDNSNFKQYLKDTFGIEKQGNAAVIINKTQYLIASKNELKLVPSSPNSILQNDYPDSLNYIFIEKKLDSLTVLEVSPKSGTWQRSFVAYDISEGNESNNRVIGSNGTGEYNQTHLTLNNKKLNVFIYYPATNLTTSMARPMIINITRKKKNYIIFGDDTNDNKRYIYQNGVVSWVPLTK